MSEHEMPRPSREQVRALTAMRDVLAFLSADKKTLDKNAKAILEAAAEYEKRVANVDLLEQATALHEQAELDRKAAERVLSEAHSKIESMKADAAHEIDATRAEVEKQRADNLARLQEWQKTNEAEKKRLAEKQEQLQQREIASRETQKRNDIVAQGLSEREAAIKAEEDRLARNRASLAEREAAVAKREAAFKAALAVG